VLTVLTCATMPLAEPGPLMVASAVIGFAGTVIYTFALVALERRVIARDLPFARAPLATNLLLAAGVCYACLMATYLWSAYGPS
jgi:hypothetical protein